MTTKPLTAAEHAHLLSLQQAVDAATNERDAFVRFLANQHGTNAQEWQLDLGTGAWVPLEKAQPGPVVTA